MHVEVHRQEQSHFEETESVSFSSYSLQLACGVTSRDVMKLERMVGECGKCVVKYL